MYGLAMAWEAVRSAVSSPKTLEGKVSLRSSGSVNPADCTPGIASTASRIFLCMMGTLSPLV